MRLIDADSLKTKVEAMVVHRVIESDYDFGGNQAFDYVADILIEDAPTIDAVEVVRCRDCKHRYGDECPMRHVEWVEYEEDGFIERDDIVHDHTVDDGFCNCGERESEA